MGHVVLFHNLQVLIFSSLSLSLFGRDYAALTYLDVQKTVYVFCALIANCITRMK